MEKTKKIYKCAICGNVVELVYEGGGQLVCCGKPMQLMQEKEKDPEISIEKHLQIIEVKEKENKVIVKVGSVPHPMEEKHYIQFIELITENETMRADLKPGQKPEASFCYKPKSGEKILARELCNLHGLWKSKN